MNRNELYVQLDQWIDAHFDEQVEFLQSMVRVPTDMPPGDNTAHALKTAELLAQFGFDAEQLNVPEQQVRDAGLTSITNLIVRRPYGQDADAHPVIALNAHGDVVPPGEDWSTDPYGAQIIDGALFGRGSAVSKSDFATYTFAVRALESLGLVNRGTIELHFTYDEEFGGELGPGWLLAEQHTNPDLLIAAGFSYEVINAHNGCLQIEVTIKGTMAHAAIPDSGADALRAANTLMTALYALNDQYQKIQSDVPGINHPYLNIGTIAGGTNTNVVPGRVTLRLDRRMIPEEDPQQVEQEVLSTIESAARQHPEVSVQTKRLLLARALTPIDGHEQLASALQNHAQSVFDTEVPVTGTPLYTDVRLYGEHGIPAVIYGAGPRTVLESNAKRADEHLALSDLKGATRVVSRALLDLLGPS